MNTPYNNFNFDGSGQPGSPGAGGPSQDGQPPVIDPKEYENLKSLLGKQGQELGEYREMFKNIEPLAQRLNEHPELADIILGKDDSFLENLIKSVSEGQIGVNEAKEAVKANMEIKNEMGDKAYGNLSVEEISKMVAERVAEETSKFRQELQGEMTTKEATDSAVEFIKTTPDFEKYREKVAELTEKFPEINDIRVLYNAAKGEMGNVVDDRAIEERAMDLAKQIAAGSMPGGFGGNHSQPVRDPGLIAKYLPPLPPTGYNRPS